MAFIHKKCYASQIINFFVIETINYFSILTPPTPHGVGFQRYSSFSFSKKQSLCMCHTFQLQRKTGKFTFEIPAGNMQSLWTYCGNKSGLLINATAGGSLYLLNKSLLDHSAYFTPALVGIKMCFKRSISISWSSINIGYVSLHRETSA